MWYTSLDHHVFYVIIGIFVAMHIALITWLYLVPLRHRKNMAKKDVQYRLSIIKKKEGQSSKNVGKNLEQSPPLASV